MAGPTIAIYTGRFLSISMTFIYRQTIGVSDAFRPIVFTSQRDNSSAFPFTPIFEQPGRSGWSRRLLDKAERILSQKYALLSKKQLNYWCQVARNEGVVLIHAHFGYGGLQMLPVAKALKIPLLTTFHGFDASQLLRNRMYRQNLQELFAYSHIIAISRQMGERLKSLGALPDRLHQHYIGVPLEDFAPVAKLTIPEKLQQSLPIQFLQVSNFVEKKGHLYTLEAFRDFYQKYPSSRLVLAGDGPLRPNMVRVCQQLGISHVVNFVGPVYKEEVVALMQQSDIFVHHSVTSKDGDQEGIPTVLMEAMAMNLPVLSTYHSGIPELVRDGVDGYLVEERDVSAYAARMADILTFPPVSSRAWVTQQFDIAKNNRELVHIYQHILDGPKAAGHYV
ncbi:MAG: glycosyltransferase [Caldilineaceae bacterium]|nr:glycosyltransferase [Caldilineaceae bacterium]